MKKQMISTCILTLFYFFLSNTSLGADHLSTQDSGENTPPRGPHIEVSAGNCDIGPFGKSGDVGKYKGSCSKLTKAEKCLAYLAYLEQDIDEKEQIYVAEDTAKTVFCLKTVLKITD